MSDPAHLAWLQAEQHCPNLQAVGRVQAERRDGASGIAASLETHYHLLSRPLIAQTFGAAVRSHWRIENMVHWVLDVTFNEDRSRIRAGYAAENVVVLRHLALNLLQHEASMHGRSLKAKRLNAAWDNAYLLTVLSAL